jgi:nitrogen fixation protein NifU and related proteins
VRDLRELYQSVILDHNRAPRNYGPLADATGQADGRNPLCGDEVTVWVKVRDGSIADIRFVGHGCAISKASASLMTTVMKGQTLAGATDLGERFHALVTGRTPAAADGGDPSAADVDPAMRRLAPLAGVSRYPERVKCATLAWHALRAALEDKSDTASPARRES